MWGRIGEVDAAAAAVAGAVVVEVDAEIARRLDPDVVEGRLEVGMIGLVGMIGPVGMTGLGGTTGLGGMTGLGCMTGLGGTTGLDGIVAEEVPVVGVG